MSLQRICTWCSVIIEKHEHRFYIDGNAVCDSCEAEYFGDDEEDG
ncbi:unnamed protein product [marine sediment metagenome]|uniref:Uncharacterized protein n=1 Tax=marine sediment metagenome TaxID=412755 RepID=X0V1F9_9ZZZZ